MKSFRVKITADKWPTDFVVEASGWGTAVNRAIGEWKRKFKGSRTKELKIHAVVGSPILRTDEKE